MDDTTEATDTIEPVTENAKQAYDRLVAEIFATGKLIDETVHRYTVLDDGEKIIVTGHTAERNGAWTFVREAYYDNTPAPTPEPTEPDHTGPIAEPAATPAPTADPEGTPAVVTTDNIEATPADKAAE